MKLEPLTARHADAVLAFETANRAYFAAVIPDRGDDFFADYPPRHAALLAMQEAGTDRFHLLTAEDGTIAGRFNLLHIAAGEADLGYRMGEAFTGRGLATRAVADICELARTAYGLERLRAAVTVDNPASKAVLLRNGFRPTGPTVLNGRPAETFRAALPN